MVDCIPQEKHSGRPWDIIESLLWPAYYNRNIVAYYILQEKHGSKFRLETNAGQKMWDCFNEKRAKLVSTCITAIADIPRGITEDIVCKHLRFNRIDGPVKIVIILNLFFTKSVATDFMPA